MKDIITDAYKEMFSAKNKDGSLQERDDHAWRLTRNGFIAGAEWMQEFMVEEQAKEKDDRDEQNDLEHIYKGDF